MERIGLENLQRTFFLCGFFPQAYNLHCNALILCFLSLLSFLLYLQENLDSLVVENENSPGEVQVKKTEMILVLLAAAVQCSFLKTGM